MNIAQYYDEIYETIPHGRQATEIISIISRYAPNAETLLDVCCGTGKHLLGFEQKYRCEGLDICDTKVEIARSRVKSPIHKADMRTFLLDKKFDVITILFASVEHCSSFEEYQKTIKNLRNHLNPGGVLLIEPFTYKDDFGTWTTISKSDEGIVRECVTRRVGDFCEFSKKLMIDNELVDETIRILLLNPNEYEQPFGDNFELIEYKNGYYRKLYVVR